MIDEGPNKHKKEHKIFSLKFQSASSLTKINLSVTSKTSEDAQIFILDLKQTFLTTEGDHCKMPS